MQETMINTSSGLVRGSRTRDEGKFGELGRNLNFGLRQVQTLSQRNGRWDISITARSMGLFCLREF